MAKPTVHTGSVASDEHLTWLVKSRSRNQKSTLRLRKLLYKHSDFLQKPHKYRVAARLLLEVNFSLWRAVFLSDLEPGTDSVIRDAKRFVDELIENNTITYTQDKSTREFTFMYYMNNARYRLRDMKDNQPEFLSKAEFPETSTGSDTGWWTDLQKASDKAFRNLKRAVNEQDPK